MAIKTCSSDNVTLTLI